MHISFRRAVQWIAENDEPLCRDLREASELISVLLIADLFQRNPWDVAVHVVAYRIQHLIGEPEHKVRCVDGQCTRYRNMSGGCDFCGAPCL